MLNGALGEAWVGLVDLQVDVEGPRSDIRLAPGKRAGPTLLELLDDSHETFLALGLGLCIR
jgi:hypothetical protein